MCRYVRKVLQILRGSVFRKMKMSNSFLSINLPLVHKVSTDNK